MKKSLLIALALLVLPFSLVVSSGTANAAVETEKSLNGRLVSDNQLKAAFGANGLSLNVASSADIPDIKEPGLVFSGRRWDMRDGSILLDVLGSYSNGKDISAGDREDILDGTFATGLIEGFFDNSEFLGELEVVSENDILHGFNASMGETNYQVAAVSFIRGNIFGVVFYATADNQLGEVLSAFGAQTANLPD